MAPAAFQSAFGRPPAGDLIKEPLKGDGSDRQWSRIRDKEKSLILVEHGIRETTGVQEVDAYISIGRHLASRQVPVPEIYAYDRRSGMVFNQDLGDTHLQRLIDAENTPQTRNYYEHVIDMWAAMALEAANGFDTAWTYQTPRYDTRVVLNNEGRYFTEAFLQGYLGWEPLYDELHHEFERLAAAIMETEISGFVHRDFQSRNLMVKNNRIFAIDFQGGRLGPIQYDLASLLIDPYTHLPLALQSDLTAYAIEKLQQRTTVGADLFIEGYRCCAVSRNLQILGAFAFLSRVKGKTRFEQYIPRATQTLVHNLACLKSLSLPKLAKIAAKTVKATLT